ncbi:MAG: 50S ribosomal protein L4 [Elusimicrobia bacterium RIFOXYC2_FULL_34_12]|nr:MAG: 50S ribosomal protein L4 [Elusimicrobia bacterium RIFOXYC2_FULL_34_12]OGS38588.1 MAG: 50S ribosomal protein L4 [Elusimicrobia bacterium RIFOXYD2_FULL_34_30]
MMEVNIYNIKGEKTGKMPLPENVFEAKINTPLIHEVVNWYLANRRQGTHAAKTRAEVSGSGKKPWKQKGTGRARAGSIRSPLWRHGGVIFAKKPREFSYSIPKKKIKLALLSSLSAKAKDGVMLVLEELKIEQPKTREVYKILKNLKIDNKTLLISKRDKTLNIASRNIATLNVKDVTDLTAYDVIDADRIIFTKESLERCSMLSI